MKSYKSTTENGGTTIILDNVQEAIAIGQKCDPKLLNEYFYTAYDQDSQWDDCVKAITTGDPKFKHKVEELIEQLEGLVDNIEPKFSQAHSGYERSEEGITTTAELIAAGEDLCALKRKHTPFKLKKGAGEGAYRLIINTDVSWWGSPEDNCALVGCLITMLQRYAPAEVWIQQGWLGENTTDGVTLFKLDYSLGLDITNLAFWICHNGKDIPFSWRINRALGRRDSGTSCVAEIDVDLMLRGDWMRNFVPDIYQFTNMLHTDRMDIMAKWIAETGMKILNENHEAGPEIHE